MLEIVVYISLESIIGDAPAIYIFSFRCSTLKDFKGTRRLSFDM